MPRTLQEGKKISLPLRGSGNILGQALPPQGTDTET